MVGVKAGGHQHPRSVLQAGGDEHPAAVLHHPGVGGRVGQHGLGSEAKGLGPEVGAGEHALEKLVILPVGRLKNKIV